LINREIQISTAIALGSAVIIYIIYQELFAVAFEHTLAGPVNAVIFILIILYIAHLKLKNKIYNASPSILWGSILLVLAFGLLALWPLTLYPLPSNTLYLLFESTSLILCLSGILLLLSGTKYVNTILIPGLLLVAVPRIIEHFIIQYSYSLQVTAAFLSALILKSLTVPVILDDIDLYLPNIQLTVDASCNGINHLLALVVLALILITSERKTLKAKLILTGCAVLLGLLLNAARISLIAVWALIFGTADLHGPANLFYVAFIFTSGSLILLLIWSKWPALPAGQKITDQNQAQAVDKNLVMKGRVIVGVMLVVGLVFWWVRGKG
jgi:exosortase/archaeosortase family protein